MPQIKTQTLLRQLFDRAVATAHPSHCLPAYLPAFPKTGRLVVVGAGKAAGAMAEVVENFYAPHLTPNNPDRTRFSGLVIIPSGTCCQTTYIDVAIGSHPLPDEHSIEASQGLLAKLNKLTAADQVLVLLSGGASALLCVPAQGISLDDKRAITQQCFQAGATIQEINTLRQCFSAVKGGQLAQACHPAEVHTFAISDVVGDQPALIGSGPTVCPCYTRQTIETLCHKYRLSLPDSVWQHITQSLSAETPTNTSQHHYHLICRPLDVLRAVAASARAAGYHPKIISANLEGEARDVAARMAETLIEASQCPHPQALISGGEVTVTFGENTADTQSNGGPNREMALALAIALDGHPNVSALVADTDGVDGQPLDGQPVAGAIINDTSLARARALNIDPKTMLDAHQSGIFFRALGDDVLSGPTNTNVNDLRVVLINPDESICSPISLET